MNKMSDKIKLLIITRGHYGCRVIDTVNTYGKGSEVSKVLSLQKNLPSFIEAPEKYIPKKFFQDIDLVHTYSLHPDLTLQVVREAKEAGIPGVIMPGEDPTFKNLGSRKELLRIAEDKVSIFGPRISCAISPPTGSDLVDRYVNEFGMPKIRVNINDNKIVEAKVLRGSPCGGTWYVAKNLIGTSVEEANRRAGLLAQYYCRAPRGYNPFDEKKGIHIAGDLHSESLILEDGTKLKVRKLP